MTKVMAAKHLLIPLIHRRLFANVNNAQEYPGSPQQTRERLPSWNDTQGPIRREGETMTAQTPARQFPSPEIQTPDLNFRMSDGASPVEGTNTGPTHMAVESLFFNTNVRTAFLVGQARGVVLLAGQQAGLSVTDYTPLQVKQGVTGYGSADKKQVQYMVKHLLGLSEIPKPDDVAQDMAISA